MAAKRLLPKLWPESTTFEEDLKLTLADAQTVALKSGEELPSPTELLRMVLEYGYDFTHEDAVRYAYGEMRR